MYIEISSHPTLKTRQGLDLVNMLWSLAIQVTFGVSPIARESWPGMAITRVDRMLTYTRTNFS